MKTYEDQELAQEFRSLAGQIPVPPGELPRPHGSALAGGLRFAGVLAGVVLVVFIASFINDLRANRQGSVGSSASPTPSPTASAPPTAFPNVTLLAGTSDGRLYRSEPGVAPRAPANVCPSQAILALKVSPDHASVIVVCGGSNGEALVLDTTTFAQRAGPLAVVPNVDAVAWAPDGKTVAALQVGKCDPQAPVCSVHVSLWDVASGTVRVIRPDEPLAFNLRWTTLGLSISFPQGPEPGTLTWDGQAWHEYSARRRLWLADQSNRAVLVEAGAGNVGGRVWERQGDTELPLTASLTDIEYPLALDGDTVVVWRDVPPGGALVIYRGQAIERVIPTDGFCDAAQQVGRWVVCTSSGSTAMAYSLDTGQIARQQIAGVNRFNALAVVTLR